MHFPHGKIIKIKSFRIFIWYDENGENWFLWSTQQSCAKMVQKAKIRKIFGQWCILQRKGIVFCQRIELGKCLSVRWLVGQIEEKGSLVFFISDYITTSI